MGKKVYIEVDVESQDAETSLNSVDNSIDNIGNSSNAAAGGMTVMAGATRKVTMAVRALGMALKAAGIGLILTAVAKLSSAMMENDAIAGELETVWTGLGNAFSRVLQGQNIGDAFKQGREDAKIMVDITRELISDEARLTRDRAVAERQVERQRQIRDDISRSYDERIAANKEINTLLQAHLKDAIQIADKAVMAAQAEYDSKQNHESLAKLYEAEAQAEEARLWVMTQQSEQLTNQNALFDEQAAFNDMLLAQAREIGTLYDERWLLDNEYNQNKWEMEQGFRESAYNEERAALSRKMELYIEDEQMYETVLRERGLLDAQYAVDTIKREKAIQKTKIDAMSQAIDIGTTLFEEGTAAHKAFAVAQAVMNTYQGATMALGSAPPPYSYVLMALTIAAGLKSVYKILATNPDQASASGGVSVAAPQPPPQNVGIMGGDSINQLSQTVSGALERPNRAYVVNDDITSAQSLDRHLEQNATL